MERSTSSPGLVVADVLNDATARAVSTAAAAATTAQEAAQRGGATCIAVLSLEGND